MKEINSAIAILFKKETIKNDYYPAANSPRSETEEDSLTRAKSIAGELRPEMNFENGRLTKFYSDLLRIIEKSYLLMSASGILLTAFQYELLYLEHEFESPRSLLWIIFGSSLILVMFTLIRHRISLIIQIKSKWEVPQTTIFTSENKWSILLECFLNLLCPMPFLYEIKFEYSSAYDNYAMEYNVNDFFSLMILFRIYYIIKKLMHFTFWNQDSARRICHMYDTDANLIFAIRCFMRYSPLRIVGTIYVVTLPMFAYCLRIAERPLYFSESPTEWSYNSFLDSMWNVIITLATVGYGDYFPRTGIGRLFAFCLCLWGSFIISLMVVAITRFIEMSPIEEKAYNLLKRLKMKSFMKEIAAGVITKVARLKLDYRNKRPKNLKRVNDIRKMLNDLKKKNRAYRSLGMSEIGFEAIYRQYVYMRDDIFTMIKSTQDLMLINLLILKSLGVNENFAERKGVKEFREFAEMTERRIKESSMKSVHNLLRIEENDEYSESDSQ